MAMFAALAFGAPLGTTLFTMGGFAAIAFATALVPLATLLIIAALPSVRPCGEGRPAFIKVAGAVLAPGLGSAFSCISFGAIITFSSLLSAGRGWTPVWLLFSVFAISLVVVRLAFGHIPDRLGGARVALISVVIEPAASRSSGWRPAKGWQ
jgi:hypothetical protein